MVGKSRELEALAAAYMANSSLNSNPFTMALNGVVDAAVNGGVNMYRTTFFVPEYIQKNPEHKKWVEELKEALMQQVRAAPPARAQPNRARTLTLARMRVRGWRRWAGARGEPMCHRPRRDRSAGHAPAPRQAR